MMFFAIGEASDPRMRLNFIAGTIPQAEIMTSLIPTKFNIPKPLLFMLVAAVGCFLFALLAEPFLWLMYHPVEKPGERQSAELQEGPQSICLTIDVSSSMGGSKLMEVKEAAKEFVGKRDLSRDRIAVVIFSNYGNIRLPFSQNRDELFLIIDQLHAEGGTNFEEAMLKSETVLRAVEGESSLILFTDGENTAGSPYAARQLASQLLKKGVKIVVIATSDADFSFLASLTQDRNRIIATRSGDFSNAFSQAEDIISSNSQLSRANQFGRSYKLLLLSSMFWTIFMCCGITLFIVGTQNTLVKKPIFIPRQFLLSILASILAGTLSGFVAQICYTILIVMSLGEFGRVIAWIIMGTILAYGLTFFIPNLNKRWASRLGALGGFLGAIGFIFVTTLTGDVAGRLLGAFIIGACIGAMVGIVEVVSRKVWLAVVYSPRDVTVVNLGNQLVTVGSGGNDTVLVRDTLPAAAEFRAEGKMIRYKGPDGKRTLEPGDRIKLGSVELVICSQDVPFSPSRFYPMKFSRAEEFKARGKKTPQS